MGRKVSPTLVGAFVLGALALAVGGVAIFGSGRLFRETYEWVCYFRGSVNGLRVGAPVKFKGVEIGSVAEIALNLSGRQRRPEEVRIPVILEIDAHRISEKGGRVTMDAAGMQAAIEQGLRAQLNTESFVTGVLYVELDYFPGTPLDLVGDPGVPYPEVPTLPTTLEQVQMKASEIISKLSAADIEGLVQSVRKTVDGLDRLVNSPQLAAAVGSLDATVANLNETVTVVRTVAADLRTELGPLARRLRTASEDANAALVNVRQLLEPGSPLTYQLGRTLQDVSEAARSVRALADYLERNPSAPVRGRPVAEDGR